MMVAARVVAMGKLINQPARQSFATAPRMRS